MRKPGYLTLVVGLVTLLVLFTVAACGEDEPNGGTQTTATPSTAGPTTSLPGPAVSTVQTALEMESGSPVRVVGALIVTYGETGEAEPSMLLTTALAESYPPQPGGPSIPVEGLNLDDLVGLTSSVGQPDTVPATWSDYWLVLEGTVEDGVLHVRETPSVVQAITPELRLRFSPVSEPLFSGDVEWFALEVRNEHEEAVDLTFSSGQQADVVFSQGGVEKYRWSEGILFTEAIETVTLAPGQTHHVILNDSLDLVPGVYEVKAWFTASAGVAGAEVQLPALEGTLQVN